MGHCIETNQEFDRNPEQSADGASVIWNLQFINIFIVNIVLNMGQFMMSSLIPKFAADMGATAAIVGMITSMFAVTALGIRPVVGPATGYFKKNRLLAAAIGIIIVAFLFYGMAHSLPMIIIGRLLHGIGMGFLAPLSLALASESLPSGKMTAGIGYFSLGQAIATAIGPSVGLELVRLIGYNMTFMIGALSMALVLVMSLRLKTETPMRTGKFRITLRDVIAFEVLTPSILMFFLSGAYSSINSFILIYGGIEGIDGIGLFFTAYAVCLLFSRPFSGKLADKYGLDKILIPGIVCFALSFVMISYSRTLPMFLIAGAVSAFGYGICQPVIQSLCMRLVPNARRGVAGNTIYIGVDLGYLIAPSIAGGVTTMVQTHSGNLTLGYAVMYRVMTIPIAIAMVIYLFKKKELKAKSEQSG
ncbi:MFS transporter [Cohnella candidum]|nr:MFS transporter [Cohnella candidum]